MKPLDLFSFFCAFCAIKAAYIDCLEEKSSPASRSKHLRFDTLHDTEQDQGNSIKRISKRHSEEALDSDDPAALTQEPTDSGVVHNLKWHFSDSSIRRLPGGWIREQVITDLPSSHDIAEWGYVYQGQVAISAVDEAGRNQYDVLSTGDIWYFPKGEGHAIVGLADENEFLLAFDDGDFQASGVTFNLDDWIAHTPKDIVAKSLDIDPSLLTYIPRPNPYILKSNLSFSDVSSPFGQLCGNSSYVFKASKVECTPAPRGGGCMKTIDSRNFPVAKTIAASVVTLEPGALREMHWHPNAEEWLYFLSGSARATVFAGNSASRTFSFTRGDTAVFPSNSGHYVENTSHNATLQYIEIYKSDRVVEVSLRRWLALTPVGIAAAMLGLPREAVEGMRGDDERIVA